jgi:hypothetical protein
MTPKSAQLRGYGGHADVDKAHGRTLPLQVTARRDLVGCRLTWQSGRVIPLPFYLADKDPGHVPGVVLTGVVVGILLLWAAIRAMFGKRK